MNINFVSPTHIAHAVAGAINIARRHGLVIPTVYNCGGYESIETLSLLEGLIDIYMPDFKYANPAAGKEYSGVEDYPAAATIALKEMYRQVGPLRTASDGVATGGLLVRHLVMPSDISHSREVIDIVARVGPRCAINVMGQYRPHHVAGEYPQLSSVPDPAEVASLRRYAAALDLMRVD